VTATVVSYLLHHGGPYRDHGPGGAQGLGLDRFAGHQVPPWTSSRAWLCRRKT
jgi:hypothetical protein